MYSDNINLIYLKFLQPIVAELNRLNKIFQLDKPDPAKLLTELLTFYRSLLERIGLPKTFQSWQDIMEFNLSDENLLPLDAVDFGVQFRLALFEANGISDLAEQDMKRRCRDYMLELSKEIRKRLPDNIKQLEALKFLSQSHTLSSSKPRIDDLPFFHLFKGDVGKAEQQWRVIHTLEWNNAEDGKTEDFWVEVSAYTDTAEQPQIWREKHQTEVLRREKVSTS
ncbi:Zinc finger MYM-type 1 [Labeo rohita]|uniref:Zinc finger MYM-type 1 n=1 Tax=Labeo rohita TaxID=84645 RepID=A0A498M687_LABRO|nr:Zinc finger MYM-type 1 [Labeo rohita]